MRPAPAPEGPGLPLPRGLSHTDPPPPGTRAPGAFVPDPLPRAGRGDPVPWPRSRSTRPLGLCAGPCHVPAGRRPSRCCEWGQGPTGVGGPNPGWASAPEILPPKPSRRAHLMSVLSRRLRSWPRPTASATWQPGTCCGPWWPRGPSWASGSKRRWIRGSW